MAVGISAAYNGDTDAPGINLSVTGLTGFENISVIRKDNTGYYDNALVRGLDSTELNGATAIAVTDFEAPIGKSVQYEVTGYDLNPGVSFRGAGTANAGATSCTPTFVAGVLSSDISFLTVVVKPYTATVATPAGWTFVTSKTSGTTASGEDTGSVNLYVFSLEGTSSNPTVTATGSNVCLGQILTYSKDSAALTWSTSVASGADNTNGTSYSATATSSLSPNAKSFLLALTGLGSNVSNMTSESLTVPNSVLSALTFREAATTTTGHNASVYIFDSSVTSNTGSGTPVFASTLSSSSTGSTVFVNLTVSEQASETTSSGSVTIPYTNSGDAWIKSVFTPTLSRKVDISQFPTFSFPTRILGNFKVLGRANPVILTDTFGGREGEIVIISGEEFQLFQEVKELLVSGGTLIFQTTGDHATTYPDFYFEIESYSADRKQIPDSSDEPVFIHKITFIEVDRPATTEEALGLRSYQTIQDEFSTYQNLKDAFATYYDALVG